MSAGKHMTAAPHGVLKLNDKGFSLLEVLLGLLIFSIGAMASALMIGASLKQNVKAKDRTLLAGLVEERLEELRSREWGGGGDSLVAGGHVPTDEELQYFYLGSLDTNFSDSHNLDLTDVADDSTHEPYYVVVWRIDDMDDSGQALKRITIRGMSMHWDAYDYAWKPGTTFDQIAIVYRETKAS